VQQQAGIVSSALLSHLCYVVSHINARLSNYPQLRVPPYGYRPRLGLMTPLPAAMSGPGSPIPPPPTPEQAAAMAAAAQRFYNELWILLGVGSLVTILRTVARVRKAGLRKLYGDDVLALVALIFYGIESGLAYSVGAHARGLANNGMTDAHRAALPTNSEEYRLRTKGSIIQLAGWSSYSLVLWTLKASWLFFYLRLTVCGPDYTCSGFTDTHLGGTESPVQDANLRRLLLGHRHLGRRHTEPPSRLSPVPSLLAD
jgi:hypothetical protein